VIVISRRRLREFWETPGRGDAERPLKTWYDVARAAAWTSHEHLKRSYGARVDLADGKYVFDIGGNKYRLVCKIDFVRRGVLTLWVGTHDEYDKLCAHGGRGLKRL
jgi:mRNA interferase HigB